MAEKGDAVKDRTAKLEVAMQLLRLSEDIVTDSWLGLTPTEELQKRKHYLKDIGIDIRAAIEKLGAIDRSF